MHSPAEIGIDVFRANRAPDGCYRTSPLKGPWAHIQGSFYHDGRSATLQDVVGHYNAFFGVELSGQEINDLVEYVKPL